MSEKSKQTLAIIAHAWNDDLTGGAFKVATDFARFLADREYEVHYLCGAESGSEHPELTDGVSVWRYAYPASSGPRALVSHVSRMGRLFRHVGRQHSFDAVSGHSPLQHYAAARQRSVCPQANFVFTVHSPMVDELTAAGRASLPVRTIGRWIDGRCLSYSDQVTTVSRYTLDRMTQLYRAQVAQKMSVRSPWVDVRRFRPAANKTEVRSRLGAPWVPDVPTLVSVRRLERRMGLDQLILAMKQICDEGETVRLLIGGSGSIEPELRAQIESLGLQETVFLLGRVPDDQLVDTFAAADCFVLPTKALECFGLITLESYACGVPVIATPVAAIPEIVTQYDASWLTAGTTAAELAAMIRRLLRNELEHDPMRLRQIAESYSLDRRASQLAETVLGDTRTFDDSRMDACEVGG